MESIQMELASYLSHEEVCDKLKTNAQNGLTQEEAKRRLYIFGYNELNGEIEHSLVWKYLEQFRNPLIILLLCSAFVSICMKQFDDAFSITAVFKFIDFLKFNF